jgi:FAD/FMN-containing dehydrogenase
MTAEQNGAAAPGGSAAAEQASTVGRLQRELESILGAGAVRADESTRLLFSQDIWSSSPNAVTLVVSPGTIEQISQALAATRRAGFAVAPRGAGMSYTGGYLSETVPAVSFDLSRMDRILAINAQDMTVTVEAGCTWSRLHLALKPLGLRTPFWGPMSGLASTIGGGLSQLNAMLGAGQHGTSSESVIALTVVLADGRILRTGARGADGDSPFYRHYGPDLAGLFCGDSGAFGIKAHVTLRLMRTPQHEDYASFCFKSGRALLEAMAEIARSGVACETCAFDPGLTRLRMQRASLGSDIKTLGAVVGNEKSVVKGLLAAGKIALAGRDLVAEDDFPLHLIAEGRSAAGVAADIAEAHRIATAHGGREVENSVARVIRAQPFPPLNSVLGPGGERWAPVHGLVALSRAADLFEAIEAEFAAMASDLAREKVTIGYLFTHMSTNAIIVEPVFYWPEARGPIHALAMEPAHLAKLPVHAANPDATAVVVAARARVIEVCSRFGCAHFQIGRAYPYLRSRDAPSRELLGAVRRLFDPSSMLNPGALGLPSDPVAATPPP